MTVVESYMEAGIVDAQNLMVSPNVGFHKGLSENCEIHNAFHPLVSSSILPKLSLFDPICVLYIYIYIELQFDVYVIYTLLSSSMFHSSINVLYTFRVQSSFSNHSHRRGRPFLSCCRAAWTRQLVVGSEC